MLNQRKPLFAVLALVFVTFAAALAVIWPRASSVKIEQPRKVVTGMPNKNKQTTTTAPKKYGNLRIPPINPKTDIINDEKGLPAVKGVLWVIWKKNIPASKKQAVLKGVKVRGELTESHLTEIEVGERKLAAIKAGLIKRPEISRVMRAYVANLDYKPSDSDYKIAARQWPYRVIEAEQAWDIERGNGATVAVIDAGFQINHPDLAGAFNPAAGATYAADKKFEGDDHGTHVSGIIGMRANRIGLPGVAPECAIVPYRAFTYAQIADAIKLASSYKNIRTINLSMGIAWWKWVAERKAKGLPKFTKTEADELLNGVNQILMPAVDVAWSQDKVIVHSAGNDASDARYCMMNTNKVITVANYGKDDKYARTSNFGNSVMLGAPGQDIWSTVNASKYDFMSGTSMATPMVAGTVALVRAANPDLTAAEVIALIRATAQPVKGKISPRLNAWQALLKATDQCGIKGKVVDTNNKPVKGATARPKGYPELAVKTEKDGTFVIAAMPRTGTIEIEIIGPKKGEPQLYDLGPLRRDQYVLRGFDFEVEPDTVTTTLPAQNKLSEGRLCLFANLPGRFQSNPDARQFIRYNFETEDFATGTFSGRGKLLEASRNNMVENIEYSGQISGFAPENTISIDIEGSTVIHTTGSSSASWDDKDIPVPLVKLRIEGVLTNDSGYYSPDYSKIRITKLAVDPFAVDGDSVYYNYDEIDIDDSEYYFLHFEYLPKR